MRLQNKRILLTGATGGIGRAFAKALDSEGAKLLLVSRDHSKLDSLAGQLDNPDHQLIVADIASEEGRSTLVSACGDDIDVLINNAGINQFGLFEDQTEEQLKRLFEINTLAPMMIVHSLLPVLRSRESIVVNVGSGFGSIGFAGYCAYSASKFALRGFSESLRRELVDSSVSVGYLAPRATLTEMNSEQVVAMNTELGNAMDSPEWVAGELLVLLKGQHANNRYLGWPERFFIKLNGLFPGLVDKALAKQLPVIRRYAMASEHKGS
jgi:short-subunit dehydrogenase